MQSRFSLNGGKVHFDRMDLVSDGARTVATGDVDLGRWPEQLYQLQSRIDFPTQKDIFFHGQKFDVSGVGDFTGTFHLFKGGRELKGTFVSPLAGVNDWRFPEPARLGAVGARSARDHQRDERALRRHARGSTTAWRRSASRRRRARRGTSNTRTSISCRLIGLSRDRRGCAWPGAPSGRNRLEWPLGKWALKTGEGEVDRRGAARRAPDDARAARRPASPSSARFPTRPGPFNPQLVARLPADRRARSSTRSIRSGFGSRRAGRRPAEPTSSSKGRRRTASSRASRST